MNRTLDDEIEACSEQDLFDIIDSIGGFSFSLEHDLCDGRIKSTPQIEQILTHLRSEIALAVAQTTRFGLQKPLNEDGYTTDEYWEWYRKWASSSDQLMGASAPYLIGETMSVTIRTKYYPDTSILMIFDGSNLKENEKPAFPPIAMRWLSDREGFIEMSANDSHEWAKICRLPTYYDDDDPIINRKKPNLFHARSENKLKESVAEAE